MVSKLLKALSAGLLIGLSVAVSIMLHPIFYIVWLIYNRRNIALWLALLVVILSVVLPFQYYSIISDIVRTDIWNPSSNPFIIYGLCLTFSFCPTRMAALKIFSVTKHRYYMAIVLFILQLIWLLIPIIPIQYSLSASYPVMQFICMEVAILLWASLVTLLYIRYPEDMLVRDIYQYVLNIQAQIREGRAGEN